MPRIDAIPDAIFGCISAQSWLPYRRKFHFFNQKVPSFSSRVYDKFWQLSWQTCVGSLRQSDSIFLGKKLSFFNFWRKNSHFLKKWKVAKFCRRHKTRNRGGPIDDAAPISSWRFRWNLFSKQSWLKSFASKSDPIRNQNSNLGPSQVYDKTTRQKNRRFFVFSNFCPTFLRGLRFSFPFSKRYQQGTTLRRKWLVWKIEEAMRINLAAAYD